MGNFELRNAVERNGRLLGKLQCLLDKDSDDLLESIIESINSVTSAVTNLTLEIDNNLTCSIAKSCNADTCETIICKVCSDVQGVAVSTEILSEGTWIDSDQYTGTLSLDCDNCIDNVSADIYITRCYDTGNGKVKLDGIKKIIGNNVHYILTVEESSDVNYVFDDVVTDISDFTKIDCLCIDGC